MLKNKGGFTLIELVMIIIILGILAAVAIPRYADLQTQAQKAVVEGTVGGLQSTAAILYASNRTSSTFAAITGNLEYASNNVILGTACSGTAYYSGNQTPTSVPFTISSVFCSGS